MNEPTDRELYMIEKTAWAEAETPSGGGEEAGRRAVFNAGRASRDEELRAFADKLDDWSVSAGMGGSPDACNAYEYVAKELRRLVNSSGERG